MAQNTAASLRAAFMRKLTQALKTKTGAVQTAATRRIFHLAVRDLKDTHLSRLNLILDYAPRGLPAAYYVNMAESAITTLVEAESRKTRAGFTKHQATIKKVILMLLDRIDARATRDTLTRKIDVDDPQHARVGTERGGKAAERS